MPKAILISAISSLVQVGSKKAKPGSGQKTGLQIFQLFRLKQLEEGSVAAN